MAGEYDKKLDEITGLLKDTAVRFDDIDSVLKTTVVRVDELRLEVRDLRKEAGEIRSGQRETNSKIDLLKGRFEDVAGVVIEDTQRLTIIEQRVDSLAQKPQ